VIKKVEVDLPVMVQDDSLMAHLIDELLLFDHELRVAFSEVNTAKSSLSTAPSEGMAACTDDWGVASSKPSLRDPAGSVSVLDVLLKEVPFDKWRNLEKSCECVCVRVYTVESL